MDNVDLRLFDQDAPLTVANFLNYVNTGRYVDSFIHRSVENFVIQGGGFTFDPADGDFTYDKINDEYPGGLQEVPEDPPVDNEFKRSNLRGTIAMAKLSGDENSATSEWFINLVDNSSSLDVLEGGYTVFGEVLSDGMTVVDGIASHITFNRTDIHPAFGELPLISSYTEPDPDQDWDPIFQVNLVRINSVTQLLSISADIDFGRVLIATSTRSVITISNNDEAKSYFIGDIAGDDSVESPFSIIPGSDSCSTTTLVPYDPDDPDNPDHQCTLEVEFSPQAVGVFNDTFNIELTDLGLSYSFGLAGEGVDTPQTIATSPDAIEFRDTQLYEPLTDLYDQLLLAVSNDGDLDLNITSATLDGADAADFEIFDNCTVFSPVLPGTSCFIPVNFKPLTTGDKSATLTLVSDDPNDPVLTLPITGTASLDTDGIPASVEDAADNDGDGNNDGVLDSIQNHVASFPAANDTYITLLATPGARLNDIAVLTQDQVPAPPDNVGFDLGLLDFRVDDLPEGAVIEVGIVLPPGYKPSTYYMYGPTPDNINPHWYEFMFDGTTGAVFLNNATIISPDGTSMQRNLIKLILQDGARGDADLLENGTIVDPGAPVVSLEEPDSGSLGLVVLLLPGIVILFRRRYSSAPHNRANLQAGIRKAGSGCRVLDC